MDIGKVRGWLEPWPGPRPTLEPPHAEPAKSAAAGEARRMARRH